MYKLCLFAGTAEGRELAALLGEQKNIAATVCVATEYGRTLLPESERLTVMTGRMEAEGMAQMLEAGRFDLVIDATHPYAARVTENIVRACTESGTEYVRLLRSGSAEPDGAVRVSSAAEAAALLDAAEGNILLTTGSKELAEYADVRGFSERVYARVLPAEESLAACRAAGLPPPHIIAMQGPFSEEMNLALLRAVSAAHLVTKEGGAAGGFEEKAAAAARAGARLIVIGRPPQTEGLSMDEVLALLRRRFGLEARPQVTVLGVGPGGTDMLTAEARRAAENADCLIGAGRLLALARPGQRAFAAVAPEAIAEHIRSCGRRRFAVLMSGDSGFFSGTRRLLPHLSNCDVRVLPGVSSLSCLCARLGVSYEDVRAVSLHGRQGDIAVEVRACPRLFVLTDGENSVHRLCRELVDAELGDVRVCAGENLGCAEERIVCGTAAELAQESFAPLSVMLTENSHASMPVSYGLPDDEFVRGAVPMTKSEVRAVCLSKLRLEDSSVLWDIGAGTGSVSVEAARLLRRGHVYAVERSDEALGLLKENCARFSLRNLTAVRGSAPEACRELPAPTHAFIGGSGGGIRSIIELLLEKNPAVRIVAAAVTLETAAELTACLRELPLAETETVLLSAARAAELGRYHLMQAQNPVFIFTLRGGGEAS